eukprot:1075405-Prymnesium_polylepis.1
MWTPRCPAPSSSRPSRASAPPSTAAPSPRPFECRARSRRPCWAPTAAAAARWMRLTTTATTT